MIKLGDLVMDKYTGFKGIAIARHSYINGCDRYTLQPQVDSEMKLPPQETFDDQQLITVEEKKEIRHTTKGGPEKYSDNRRY